MQLGAACATEAEAATRVPASLRACAVVAPLAGRELRSAALRASGSRSHHRLGACGAAVSSASCMLSGLESRALGGQAARALPSADASPRCLYETAWQSARCGAVASGHAFRLARPRAAGADARPCGLRGGLAALVRACAAALELSVCAASLGAPRPSLRLETWCIAGARASPTGARAGAESCCGGVRGLLRAAATELGAVRVSLVQRDGRSGSASGVGCWLPVAPPGSELGWRAGGALLARLLPASAGESSEQLRLLPSPRGSLSALRASPFRAAEAASARALAEVRVVAVGLNFRDVLNVLGLYPGDAGPPGSDCAVLAVSGSAPALRSGDAAFGLALGALGTRARSAAQLMPAKPPSLRFEAAASLPTVFVTADAALRCGGGSSAAVCVLVHAASGGVGLALAQLAAGGRMRAAGTCGSRGKRALLRTLGVRALCGSRVARFAEALAV
jgi:hypothetical protein